MTPAAKITPIVAKIAQPWRREPTIRPKVAVRAAGMLRIMSTCRRFVKEVGFSSGWAELTL